MIYILFAVFTIRTESVFVLQRDFKTKIECETVLRNIEKRLSNFKEGFCQELREWPNLNHI